MLPRPLITLACALVLIAICSSPSRAQAADAEANWPQFRGAEASGSARTPGPVEWDIGASKNVLWNVAVPGLGHSAPVVWGDRIFLTTALPLLPDGGDQNLKTGL